MARADGLRDDFAEDDDDAGGEEATHQAGRQVGRQDRNHRVHQRVAEQKRAEQLVASLAHGVDDLRPSLFVRGAAVDDDVEPLEGEREEAERESGKPTGHHHEDDHAQQVHDGELGVRARHRAGGVLLALLPAAVVRVRRRWRREGHRPLGVREQPDREQPLSAPRRNHVRTSFS